MGAKHLTRGFMGETRWGEVGGREFLARLIGHVTQECPECLAVFTAWEQEARERVSQPQPEEGYPASFEGLRTYLEREQARLEEEERRGSGLLAELERLPLARRKAAVEAEPQRFHGAVLAARLLERVLEHLPGDPRGAYAVAELAATVLHHTSPDPYAVQLYARALAHMGNARRAQGDLRSASALMRDARFILTTHKAGDRLVAAELDHLEGALRRAQRRLGEAEELLRHAVEAYEAEDHLTEAAQVLLTLGLMYSEKGEPEKALQVTEQALPWLAADPDFRHRLYGEYNRAYFLCEAGRFQEARRVLNAIHLRFEELADRISAIRWRWLEGRIARGLNEVATAEGRLAEVRLEFAKEGMGYDAALASLDLASLYLEQGDVRAVKLLAAEMVSLFQARDVHREAQAALTLFYQAAEREGITSAFLKRLAAYLQRARHDPSLKFRNGE